MKILLLANTVFELLVAVVVVFAPSILGGVNTSNVMARVLGGNALGLATLSAAMFLLNPKEFRYLQAGFIALAVFHTSVTVAQIFNTLEGAVPFPVVLVHGLFALSFSYFTHRIFVTQGK